MFHTTALNINIIGVIPTKRHRWRLNAEIGNQSSPWEMENSLPQTI